MPEAHDDLEINALQALIQALEPLYEDARQRVVDYTMRRLGMRPLRSVTNTAEIPYESGLPVTPGSDRVSPPAGQVIDIRSLRDAKEPKTAIEMATLVAYYLAESAPEGERKQE